MHFCKGRLLLTKMADKCGISREGSVGGQLEEVSIKQSKIICKFGLPSIIAYSQKEHHSSLSSSFLSSVTSRFISFCIISQKTCLAVRCTELPAFQPTTLSHRFQIRNTAYRSGICTSTKYICAPQSKSKTYLSALPAILFQKIKTSCYA